MKTYFPSHHSAGFEAVRDRVRDRENRTLRKEDVFFNSRRKIGLYPIKAKHILTWFDGEYYPREDEIVNLYRERDMAFRDLLKNELKWTHQLDSPLSGQERERLCGSPLMMK